MPNEIKDQDKMPLQKRIELLADMKKKREQELKELEEKSKKESEKIDSEIFETIKELNLEAQKEFFEEQKKQNKEKSSEELLEDKVSIEKTETQNNVTYVTNKPTMNLYELTNYNLYSKIKELVNKAENNFISPEERNFLSTVSYNIEKIKKENPYSSIKQYDSSGYMSRTSNLLQKLDKDLNRFW